MELKSNDVIYLFSDGYADQFGGEFGKKFRYKRFQELLVEIAEQPTNKQKEKLETVFINWRGSLDQIDDVLVFGFKIK
jgi:serine phosphatase RsbU (regulator of sigma subunit)